MKHYVTAMILLFACCNAQVKSIEKPITETAVQKKEIQNTRFDTATQTLHVFVALCDNTYQGIVPVPPKIGNGQDPYNNLYWGCAFGIKTFFKKSPEWTILKTQKVDTLLLERLVFKHRSKNIYLVADAYNGKYIKTATKEFLFSCSGQLKDTLHINNTVIGTHGNAKLVSYIGHDGLMDFQLQDVVKNADGQTRDCIILACISKSYFSPHVRSAKAHPLLWTTGLMCPEAYTLHDALTGYILKETPEAIRTRAGHSYSVYQKCSEKAARNLLVTGW